MLDALRSCSIEPYTAACLSKDGGILSNVPVLPDMEEQWKVPHLLTYRADILEVFVSQARTSGVTLHLASPIACLDFCTPAATTISGTRFSADFILGADSERSFCRSKLLTNPKSPILSGKIVYRITVRSELLSQHQDLEPLICPPRVTFWVGLGAQVVCYELKRNNV